MSTRQDWMDAVAAGTCTIGLLEFIRKAEEARQSSAQVKVDERQMEFGLDHLTRKRKPRRTGPTPKTDRKG